MRFAALATATAPGNGKLGMLTRWCLSKIAHSEPAVATSLAGLEPSRSPPGRERPSTLQRMGARAAKHHSPAAAANPLSCLSHRSRLRRKRGASDRHGRSFWAGQGFHLGIELLGERLDDTRAEP